MKSFAKALGVLLVVLVVGVAGAYLWASRATSEALAATVSVEAHDFPIPFPLDSAEIAEAGLSEAEAAELARERAIERGKHLTEARYGCRDCHGANFGGGTMMDAGPVAKIFGPNLTSGTGSRVASFTAADWDRTVRHGVMKEGHRATMPSIDFLRMSDQELADIITYIESLPPVDAEIPPPAMGPIGKFLVATGRFVFSADMIEHGPHGETPPVAAASVEFGEHLAGVCVGCHQRDMAGGPIVGGDPSWAPAANLTPHPDALGGWSLDDFRTAMREMKRPDGTELVSPMTLMAGAGQAMTDVEIEAMYLYLQTLEPIPPRE